MSETNGTVKRLDRRRFLSLLAKGSVGAACAAGVGQTLRFLSFQPPNSGSTVLPAGQPESFLSGSLLYVAGARAYVGRDGGGLYAVDAVCTHLGCLVEKAEGGGFVCPCHDSRFDAAGRPENGPATEPLRYLHLWFDQEEGQLFVDRSRQVDSNTRLIL